VAAVKPPLQAGRRLALGRLILLVPLLVSLLVPTRATGQAETQGELQIKAVFLYKFGSYVDWPAGTFAQSDSPLVIGLVNAEALADEVAQVVSGRTLNGRPIVVRKLRRGSPLAGVNILFVGRAEAARMAEVLAPAKGQPILTVTDSEQAFEHGGMINFVLVGDKVRFDVAPSSAERGNLKISARLLAVARKVLPG
jgi:hypothetical protein